MIEEDLKELASKFKTFDPGMLSAPYSGVPSFFRASFVESVDGLDIALVGIPFDTAVTNRSGTRMGPREMRNQSCLVGFYNHRSRMTPYEKCRVADIGDVPLSNVYDLEKARDEIIAFYKVLAEAKISPVTAGGDHSITYPILQGLNPGKPIALIHFDSHCDTSPENHGASLHHGCPMRNAVISGAVDPKHTVQIGIRGSTDPLWQFSYDSGMRVIHIEEFYEMGWKKAVSEIRKVVGDYPAYISFDIDCLDPAFAPGTGTPVVGGMTSFEALQVLNGLRGLNIIGGDVVEVSPPYDSGGITALAGATIMFEILCLVAENQASKRP